MTATPTRFIRASIVNEGKVEVGDVLIARDGTIGAVGTACDQHPEATDAVQIDAQGLWLMPGAIDDQVHFREPGLTHKGEIATESAAAAAGDAPGSGYTVSATMSPVLALPLVLLPAGVKVRPTMRSLTTPSTVARASR